MKTNRAYCPDCGPATVSHRAEWLSAFFESAFSLFVAVFEFIWRNIGAVFYRLPVEKFAVPLLKALVVLRVAKFTDKLDAEDNLRTQALWESAEKRGIALSQFRLFGNPHASFIVARRGNAVRVFDGLPRVERIPSSSLKWMDNKSVMRKKFLEEGIPVANGGTCFTFSKALKVFRGMEKPAIIKPHIGSRSRHTFMHINTEKDLVSAFRKAKHLSPWVIVEGELDGMVFRASVVAGKLVGIIRREPPHVIGDGVSTVRALVEKENQNPLRQGPIFHTIPLDEEADAELKR